MKPFLALLFITSLSLGIAFSQVSQTALVKVAKTNQPQDILLSPAELEAFIYQSYGDFGQWHPNFDSLSLFNSGGRNWYLMGYSTAEQQYYALELIRIRRNLFLSAKKYMHQCSCETEASPESVFVLHEEKIRGCQSGSHTVSVGEINP